MSATVTDLHSISIHSNCMSRSGNPQLDCFFLRKDMIRWQEVPAEDLVGQSQVALEDGGHLGVEVFSAAELLKNLHGQNEDLT